MGFCGSKTFTCVISCVRFSLSVLPLSMIQVNLCFSSAVKVCAWWFFYRMRKPLHTLIVYDSLVWPTLTNDKV